MSHSNKPIGDSKILQRKIPSTGRYNDVQPRVDTGSSMTRYMKRIEDMQTTLESSYGVSAVVEMRMPFSAMDTKKLRNVKPILILNCFKTECDDYRYKNNELFRRMKATTLAQLVLQVANISMQDDSSVVDLASPRSTLVSCNGGDTNRDGIADDRGDKTDDSIDQLSPRSSLQSVIRGVGEIDLLSGEPAHQRSATPYLEKPYEDCPYLLLDVRDNDEYQLCHITGAKNFPIAMLSRTMNNYTKEILEYKNCPGRIIILYDEDERISTVAATTMVERGFDNIFILSGGLKVMGQKIPDGIVNGTYPASCRISSSKKSRSQHSIPIPADPKKKRFSAEDLDKVNHYLEESLIPQDTGSRLSRLTNNSRQPNSSSKASMTSSIVGSRRAWR